MGRSSAIAESAVRLSFGRPTSVEDVNLAIDLYRAAVTRLRGLLRERSDVLHGQPIPLVDRHFDRHAPGLHQVDRVV